MAEFFGSFLIKLSNAILFSSFQKAYENKSYLKFFFQSKLRHRNERIRISISGLYRIQIMDKFLLIRGNRIPNQYQPVGGVFKFYKATSSIFNKLGVSPDHSSFGLDSDLEDDLRVYLPAKNLIKFLKWYNEKKEREILPTREFREELLSEGFLNPKIFVDIKENHIKQVTEGILFSKHFNCFELRIAEIFTIEFTPEQERELKNSMQVSTDRIIWISEEEIRRHGYNPQTQKSQYNIAETAKWTLNN